MGRAYCGVFLAAFFAIALWESKRPLGSARRTGKRWAWHATLFAMDSVLMIFVVRVSPLLAAFAAQQQGFGLLTAAGAPLWIGLPATLIALDLTQYLVHRLLHSVGWLWRIHEIHHSDEEFDVSTAVRFHPVETAVAQVASSLVVLLLGAPPLAVAVNQLIVVAENLFVHANCTLPPRLKWLSTYLMTPNLHRIHHSTDWGDQQRNFGQLLTVWDRVLGTYRAHSDQGLDLPTGVEELRGVETLRWRYLLLGPFLKRVNFTGSAGPAARLERP